MKFCLLIVMLLFSHMSIAADRCVQDDAQRTLCFAHPVRRIVSLAPNLTELAFAAGAGAYVVGVDANSDYPPPARTIASVGRFPDISIEKLVQLQPDLVLLWWGGNQSRTIAQLQALHIPYFLSQVTQLADIPATIQRFGKLTATEHIAQQHASLWTQQWHHLQQQYAQNTTPVPVFFIIASQPLMSIGGGQFINQVIALCGGKNLFANRTEAAFSITKEALLAYHPQYVIAMQSAQSHMAHDPFWKAYSLIFLPDDWIARNGPRLLKAASQLCPQLHPQWNRNKETP